MTGERPRRTARFGARAARALLCVLVVPLAAGVGACGGSPAGGATAPPGVATAPPGVAGDAALARAFQDHASGAEVQGEGTVARLLAEDLEGGRHQRFILALASGQTVLVAHNIDVAPRLEDLRVGDRVAFRGVYEWNAQGGVVHWTHHDPTGDHAGGWLRHDGVSVD